MSLFTKNCLRISGIAIVLGVVLVCIALVSGVGINGSNRKDYVLDFNSEYNEEITSIKIELNIANVKIKRGNTFAIDAKNMNKKTFNSFVDNNVWTIKDDENDGFRIFGHVVPFFNNDVTDAKYQVTIYIPDNFEPKNLEISIGAGRAELCDMETDYVDFEIGAGELVADKLIVNNESSLEVGAGKIAIKDLIAKDVSLDCGVGEIDIKGDIRGSSSANCGMGHISIKLKEPESRYDFGLSCGLGNININGDNYSFTSDSNRYGNDAEYEFDIECGVGSVEVSNE
ncbi:MAG: DUF4097 family beta strand repeat protein [Clostridiales bacterium]|nr:DUF4097 family beta strand repeat protein [Clostridiales bacterium]